MGLFDPWLMGQNFGGILGGVAPGGYSQQDIDALIKGYGPQWGNLPRADAPQIPMDPSGSAPMGSAKPNPYGDSSGLMPSFTSTVSTEQLPPQQPFFHIVPGSFADKLFGQPQMAANAAPSPQQPQQPQLGSGAEPSAVWRGPGEANAIQNNPPPGMTPPPMANVPMPLPRPAPGVNLGMPSAQQPPAPQAPQPVQPQPAPSPQPQVQAPQSGPGIGDRFSAGAAGFFNAASPMQAIGNLLGGAVTGQRQDAAGRSTLQETGSDPFTGQKTFAWINPANQTMTPATMGGMPSGTGNAPGGMGQFSEAIRAGVSGQQLMALAPPQIKNRLQAMLEGREAPPTQAAMRNPAVMALMDAAHAIDPNFDETAWRKRSEFIVGLQKGTPSSLGGQRNMGNTALEHLSTVAEKAEAMGNTDLGGWAPGIAALANKGRQALSADQAAKANALNDAVDRYVAEVGRYYSGSSSGGAHEREAARQRFSSVKTNQELSAAIQVEKELFHGKLKQMEEQRDEALGPYAKNYAMIQPHGEKALSAIDATLSRMRGGSSAPTSAPSSAGWSVKKL